MVVVVVVGIFLDLSFCTRGMEPVIFPGWRGDKHSESIRLGHGADRGLTGPFSGDCWSAASENKAGAPNGNFCQPRRVLKIG